MANKIYYGTGHRKSSIAKVRMTSGKGNITINGRDVNEYLPFPTLVMDLKQPLEATNTLDKFDINVEEKGGGFSGQTGFRRILKAKGFITRDSKIKERKKPGLKKARKAPQFSKR